MCLTGPLLAWGPREPYHCCRVRLNRFHLPTSAWDNPPTQQFENATKAPLVQQVPAIGIRRGSAQHRSEAQPGEARAVYGIAQVTEFVVESQ
jgi:hypothetical protein